MNDESLTSAEACNSHQPCREQFLIVSQPEIIGPSAVSDCQIANALI
jgi:hypothetical protein